MTNFVKKTNTNSLFQPKSFEDRIYSALQQKLYRMLGMCQDLSAESN